MKDKEGKKITSNKAPKKEGLTALLKNALSAPRLKTKDIKKKKK